MLFRNLPAFAGRAQGCIGRGANDIEAVCLFY